MSAMFVTGTGASRWFGAKRVAMAAAGFVIGCTALWIATRNVNWSDVITVVVEGDLRLALLGTLLYVTSLLVRAWRWHLLLRELEPLRYRTVTAATFVGFAANYLL